VEQKKATGKGGEDGPKSHSDKFSRQKELRSQKQKIYDVCDKLETQKNELI